MSSTHSLAFYVLFFVEVAREKTFSPSPLSLLPSPSILYGNPKVHCGKTQTSSIFSFRFFSFSFFFFRQSKAQKCECSGSALWPRLLRSRCSFFRKWFTIVEDCLTNPCGFVTLRRSRCRWRWMAKLLSGTLCSALSLPLDWHSLRAAGAPSRWVSKITCNADVYPTTWPSTQFDCESFLHARSVTIRLSCDIRINFVVCVWRSRVHTQCTYTRRRRAFIRRQRLARTPCTSTTPTQATRSNRPFGIALMETKFVIESSVLWQKPLNRVSILYCTIVVVCVVCRVSRNFFIHLFVLKVKFRNRR